MSEIQQIYCTHCTYGASALENRTGEMALRVLGYSVRAGSEPPERLKQVYRRLERYLYYYLPPDSPAEEKVRRDAASAPRRLIFIPGGDDMQLLGQVCYRPKDTAGRPGSYFAHFLYTPKGAAAWSAADCLQLWGAPWREVDDPFKKLEVGPVAQLSGLRQSGPPALDEALALSFLTAGRGEAFADPRGLIPDRWRDVPPQQRQSLLRELIAAYLQLDDPRRENILLVVEPEIAALLFYALVRLLPRGRLRQEISFSTYEPQPERLPVTLAATTLHRPETGDIKPEAQRPGVTVIHTWRLKDRRPSAVSAYADAMLRTLLAEGWLRVDATLSALEAAGAGQRRELDGFARLEPVVANLLSHDAPAGPTHAENLSDAQRRFVAQTLCQRIGLESGAMRRTLEPLVQSGRGLALLEFLSAPPPEVQRGAQPPDSRRGAPPPHAGPATIGRAILGLLSPRPFAEALESPRVDESLKFSALAEYLKRERDFPPGSAAVWTSGALDGALAQISPEIVRGLWQRAPAERRGEFFLALGKALAAAPTLAEVYAQVVADERQLDDAALVRALLDGERDSRARPPREATLARRLDALLTALPFGPDFSARLRALSAWVEWLGQPGEGDQLLGKWSKIQNCLVELRDSASPGGPSAADYNRLGYLIAENLRGTLPSRGGMSFQYYVYPEDDTAGVARMQALTNVSGQLFGGREALPAAVQQSIARFIIGPREWHPPAASGAAEGSRRPVAGKSGKGQPSKGEPSRLQGLLQRFGLKLLILMICLIGAGGLGIFVVNSALSTTDPLVVSAPANLAARDHPAPDYPANKPRPADEVKAGAPTVKQPAADARSNTEAQPDEPAAHAAETPAEEPDPPAAPAHDDEPRAPDPAAARAADAGHDADTGHDTEGGHDADGPTEDAEPIIAPGPAVDETLVDEWKPLPAFTARSGVQKPAKEDLASVLAKGLPDAARIELLGLEAINKRSLEATRSRLETETTDGKRLELYWASPNTAPGGGGRTKLAQFWTVNGELRFRWLQPSAKTDQESLKQPRTMLAACIVEVGADDQWRRVALCPRVQGAAVTFDAQQSCAKLLDRALRVEGGPAFLANENLKVRRGVVTLANGGRLPFQVAANQQAAWQAPRLAESLGLRDARLSFHRPARGDVWRVKVDATLKNEQAQLAPRKDALEAADRELTQLTSALENVNQAAQLGKKDQELKSIQSVARLIGAELDPPPPLPNGMKPEKRNAQLNDYAKSVEKLVMRPAREKLEQLKERQQEARARLEEEVGRLESTRREHLAHIQSLSLVLARELPREGSRPIVSEDIVLGAEAFEADSPSIQRSPSAGPRSAGKPHAKLSADSSDPMPKKPGAPNPKSSAPVESREKGASPTANPPNKGSRPTRSSKQAVPTNR